MGGGYKSLDTVKSSDDVDVEVRSSTEAVAAVLMGIVAALEGTSVVQSSLDTMVDCLGLLFISLLPQELPSAADLIPVYANVNCSTILHPMMH